MKRDPTIQQALESGVDCSVLAMSGSVSPFYAVCNVAHDEHAMGYPIARDNLSADLGARREVPDLLRTLRFRLVKNEHSRSRVSGIAADVIKVARAFDDPPSHLRGICNLVSEQFRNSLADTLGSECEFVPTKLEGAEGAWFVLWITALEEAVDEAASNLEVVSWRETGEELLRPIKLRFKADAAKSKHLFRVSQWRYFLEHDLCTKDFVRLFEARGLRGAEWISAGGTGPFVKS